MLAYLKVSLLAAGLTLTMATAPQAATKSFNLNVTFLNGPLVGSPIDPFLLTFFYDTEDLNTEGDGFLAPPDGLQVVFDGVQVEELDVDYPDYPQVQFDDYMPFSINFLIDALTLPELLGFGIVELWIGGDLDTDVFFDVLYDSGTDSYSTGATVFELAPIPLPAGLPLLAGGLGLMVLASRRRTRN